MAFRMAYAILGLVLALAGVIFGAVIRDIHAMLLLGLIPALTLFPLGLRMVWWTDQQNWRELHEDLLAGRLIPILPMD